jgi:SAM-dependent methyltransferase
VRESSGRMLPGYSPDRCDLCGSSNAAIILDRQSPRTVRGDNRVVAQPLRKLECALCGLVRDGNAYSAESLIELYGNDYGLDTNEQEYQFLTRDGPIPRSRLVHEWMWQYLEQARREQIRSALEIGCGAGYLLQRVQAGLPWARCAGAELNVAAREKASRIGCRIIPGGIEGVSDSFDLIYAVTVLEHVPKPGHFLTLIRERLSASGSLVLIQPTQDVPSADIYFSEHLHHFGPDHLSMYAGRIGFIEKARAVGHPLMPNFSLHVWERAARSSGAINRGRTCCSESVARHEADFARVSDVVREIEADPVRGLAVFGLNERYALLTAYSRLGDARIVCGLSDVEPSVAVDFPVVKPEAVTDFPVTDVLLCVNPVHLGLVRDRLAPFNVTVHVI